MDHVVGIGEFSRPLRRHLAAIFEVVGQEGRAQARRDWLQKNTLPGFVQYFSLAAFTTRAHLSAALAPVWKRLLRYDYRNDGQVLARDSLIPGSTLLGYLDADHWSAAIDVESVHPVIGARRAARSDPAAGRGIPAVETAGPGREYRQFRQFDGHDLSLKVHRFNPRTRLGFLSGSTSTLARSPRQDTEPGSPGSHAAVA